MVRNQLSLVLVILLILEACFALPVFSKTYTDGSGNVLDEAAFDPIGVVADGSSYRKAVSGDKNIRYRILRSYSVRMETSDGGTSWNPAAYWKTTSGGKVEPRLSTLEFEMDLPTPNAVDVQTSAYTNLTPWRGLYYPVSDKQNIDTSESELNDLKDAYNKEVYSFSANIYSIVPTIVSRDEAAGTTLIKVSIQFSLPRDGTICENQIPNSKYNPYLEKNTDIKLLSGCDEEEISADAEARTQYLLYGDKINEYLKKYAESIWNNDTEGADSIYKKCKEHVNTENFGTLKKRFEDMKAAQTASREFLDAHYRTWIESEYAAINADYDNQMKNIETYTHKWFDAWLAEYNREHPTAQYHPTAADMQEIYQKDRDAYTEYMQKEYGDAFQNGSVKITDEAYAEYRYQSMLSWVQKVTDEYYSYSWNLPFTISYQIGKKCEYCGDILDPDAEENHCSDDSCKYYKNYDDTCGCCQICSACNVDVVRGHGNTTCAQGCDEYGTDECSCYKPATPPISDPYVTKGSSVNTNTATSIIRWQERWSHVIYYYTKKGYLRRTTCHHTYKYQAFLETKVALRNSDQSSWSSAFSSLRSGYGFAAKMTCTGYITGQDSCMSGSSWRCEGGYTKDPDHTVYMPYGNSTSYNTSSNYVICDTSKFGNVSYRLTSGKKATQGTTIQFQSVTDSGTPKFTAVIPSDGTKVTNIYEPVKSSLSTYGYRNIYTPAKLKDGNHHVYFKVYSGGLEYSGLHKFIINSVDRYVTIKGSMYDDTGVVVH